MGQNAGDADSKDDAELALPTLQNLQNMNKKVYTAMAGLLKGEGLGRVRNTPERNGFEAWRKVHARYGPRTAGRKRTAASRIRGPPQVKLELLSHASEVWERQVRGYENSKGAPLGHDIKCAALTQMCPDKLQQHNNLSISRLNRHGLLREEIALYLQTIRPNDDSDPSGLVSMGLGSLSKGKKGEPKGGGGGGTAGSGQRAGRAHTIPTR